MNSKIIVYSDGACSGNQNANNVGGWGAVIIAIDPKGAEVNRAEIFGGALNTTNNIMELKASIQALSKLKRADIPVEVYLDSNYVLQGITEWIFGWKQRGWKKSNKKPVENIEYWIELDKQRNRFEHIQFFKVKGHSGNLLNDLADKLANKGMDSLRKG